MEEVQKCSSHWVELRATVSSAFKEVDGCVPDKKIEQRIKTQYMQLTHIFESHHLVWLSFVPILEFWRRQGWPRKALPFHDKKNNGLFQCVEFAPFRMCPSCCCTVNICPM
jgi:hypothetical protein